MMTPMQKLIRVVAVVCLALLCAPAHGSEPLATGYTNWDDVTIELMVVERKGSVLTVKWAAHNEGDERRKVRFNLTGDAARTYVVDEENGTKYYVLTDEEGNCLASECGWLGSSSGIGDDIDGGKTKRYWMKFPAPPPDVSSVTVFFDETEPLEDVPISDK